MKISVIIPAYNESARIGATLHRLHDYFFSTANPEKSIKFEIIVVDDGSTDGTSHLARQTLKKLFNGSSFDVINYPENMGKGYAVKKGFEKASGDYSLIYDADGATPINELGNFLEINRSHKDEVGKEGVGYDAIIGQRKLGHSYSVDDRPKIRKMISWATRIFTRFIVRDINDTQCGFKLIKRDIINKILPDLSINRFGADIELLALIQREGGQIKEVPVIWNNDPDSKVRPIFDSIISFLEYIAIVIGVFSKKYELKKSLNKNKSFFGLLWIMSGASMLLIHHKRFYSLLFDKVIPGWDGSAHLAITKVFADHIFPATWGWVDSWYLGMPFPQFYPPLFYWLEALWSKTLALTYPITHIDFELAFRLFVLLTQISIPFFVALLANKIFKNKFVTILTALLSTLFLCYSSVEAHLGITVSSTINTALYANMVGFIFMIMWVYYLIDFLDQNTNNKNQISILKLDSESDFNPNKSFALATVFLSLTFLTNTHLAFTSLFIFIGVLLAHIGSDHKHQTPAILWKYFMHGLCAIALSSFWLIPMIARYSYFTSTPIPVDQGMIGAILKSYLFIPFMVIFSFGASILGKHIYGKAINLSILLTGIIIGLSVIFPIDSSAPLHFARWIAPILLLSTISIAHTVWIIVENVPRRMQKTFLIGILLFFFLVSFPYIYLTNPIYGTYDNERNFSEGFDKIIDEVNKLAINEGPRTVLVEADTSDETPRSFSVDAYLGINGHKTIFSNIRESSMSGLYLTPFRNSLSDRLEMWGIRPFTTYPDIHNSAFKSQLNYLRYLGVNTIISNSNLAQETLSLADGEKGGTNLAYSGARWNIYTLNDIEPTIQKLKTKPILVYAPIKLNERSETDLSFSLLAESLVSNLQTEPVLIRGYGDKKHIQAEQDLIKSGQVGAIVVLNASEIKSSSLDEEILNFGKNGGLIYANSDSVLGARLDDQSSKNIKTYQSQQLSEMIQTGTLAYLLTKETESGTKKVLLDKTPEQTTDVTATGTATATTSSAYIIKRSYFPDWNSNIIDSGQIYLASPSLILVFADSSKYSDEEILNSLVFQTPPEVKYGYLITFITLILLIIYANIFARKNKGNGNATAGRHQRK